MASNNSNLNRSIGDSERKRFDILDDLQNENYIPTAELLADAIYA